MLKEKLHNINFLRIIGAISIVLLHYHVRKVGGAGFYSYFRSLTRNGQKAVDLFFMISGLFFVLTLDTRKSVYDFLKKKVIRLWPVLLFATTILFVFSLLGIRKFDIYANVLNILGIRALGYINGGGHISDFWYCSALIWTLLLLFYCRKYFDEKKFNLVLGIATILSYTILLQSHLFKINRDCPIFLNMVTGDMLRAIGGMGIGYFIGLWYQDNVEKIKAYQPSVNVKIAISTLETLCLFFIISRLMFFKMNQKQDMIFIVSFMVIIVLFLFKKGFLSRLCDAPIMDTFARYTYSLYLTHKLVFYLGEFITKKFPTLFFEHQILFFASNMVVAVAFAIFTYHFVETKAIKYFANKE